MARRERVEFSYYSMPGHDIELVDNPELRVTLLGSKFFKDKGFMSVDTAAELMMSWHRNPHQLLLFNKHPADALSGFVYFYRASRKKTIVKGSGIVDSVRKITFGGAQKLASGDGVNYFEVRTGPHGDDIAHLKVTFGPRDLNIRRWSLLSDDPNTPDLVQIRCSKETVNMVPQFPKERRILSSSATSGAGMAGASLSGKNNTHVPTVKRARHNRKESNVSQSTTVKATSAGNMGNTKNSSTGDRTTTAAFDMLCSYAEASSEVSPKKVHDSTAIAGNKSSADGEGRSDSTITQSNHQNYIMQQHPGYFYIPNQHYGAPMHPSTGIGDGSNEGTIGANSSGGESGEIAENSGVSVNPYLPDGRSTYHLPGWTPPGAHHPNVYDPAAAHAFAAASQMNTQRSVGPDSGNGSEGGSYTDRLPFGAPPMDSDTPPSYYFYSPYTMGHYSGHFPMGVPPLRDGESPRDFNRSADSSTPSVCTPGVTPPGIYYHSPNGAFGYDPFMHHSVPYSSVSYDPYRHCVVPTSSYPNYPPPQARQQQQGNTTATNNQTASFVHCGSGSPLLSQPSQQQPNGPVPNSRAVNMAYEFVRDDVVAKVLRRNNSHTSPNMITAPTEKIMSPTLDSSTVVAASGGEKVDPTTPTTKSDSLNYTAVAALAVSQLAAAATADTRDESTALHEQNGGNGRKVAQESEGKPSQSQIIVAMAT